MGSLVARWQEHRYLQEVGGSGFRSRPDIGLRWDGTQGDVDECTVHYHSALSWSADGKTLAFLHRPETLHPPMKYVVRAVSGFDGGIPIKTDCKVVSEPAFSPRGDYLAYGCIEDLSAVSIYLHNLSNSGDTQLLQGLDGVGGLVWSSNGRRIVFSTAIFGGELWEVSLDSPSHREKLPFGQDGEELTVSYTGHRLAYKHVRTNTNIWRLDLTHPKDPVQRSWYHLANSTHQTTLLTGPRSLLSPTGLVVRKYRPKCHGSNAVQLSSFGITFTGSPRWSTDGKFVAFDSRAGGESTIYIVDKRGGTPKKLNVDLHELPAHMVAQWRLDLLSERVCRPFRHLEVTVYRRSRVTTYERYVVVAVESPTDNVYFSGIIGYGECGPTDSRAASPRHASYGLLLEFTPFGGGLYFLAKVDEKYEIYYFDLNTKQVRPIHVMDKPAPNFMGQLSVSSDGRWLLFAQGDEFSSDLMMVENWR